MNLKNVVPMVALLLVTGCHSLGPQSITRDRFAYGNTMAQSWKQEMLLNLVKTRYLDVPIYLEVGQIVSGYTLETGVSIHGQASPQSMRGDTFGGLGASGTFTDRPTITYSPMTGEKFLRGFLDPISPQKVLAALRSGYAADFILAVCLDTLNGRRNRRAGLDGGRAEDPGFARAAFLLRQLQEAGTVEVRAEQSDPGRTVFLLFRTEAMAEETMAQFEELRQVLRLSPTTNEFRVISSPLPGGPGEVALTSRTLLQIMGALSLGVEIPPAHVQRRLTPEMPAASMAQDSLLRIHSGLEEPEDAFVAVPYEGAWFWIAHDDWVSKRTFSSILFLFTLADEEDRDPLPLITIPAQ